MDILKAVIWVVNLISAVTIVLLILLQHGRGADVGAAFGGGASGSLFGVSGSANFLSRMTAVIAVIFFCSSLSLVYLSSDRNSAYGVMGERAAQQKADRNPAGSAKNGSASDKKIPD